MNIKNYQKANNRISDKHNYAVDVSKHQPFLCLLQKYKLSVNPLLDNTENQKYVTILILFTVHPQDTSNDGEGFLY